MLPLLCLEHPAARPWAWLLMHFTAGLIRPHTTLMPHVCRRPNPRSFMSSQSAGASYSCVALYTVSVGQGAWPGRWAVLKCRAIICSSHNSNWKEPLLCCVLSAFGWHVKVVMVYKSQCCLCTAYSSTGSDSMESKSTCHPLGSGYPMGALPSCPHMPEADRHAPDVPFSPTLPAAEMGSTGRSRKQIPHGYELPLPACRSCAGVAL